MPAKRILSIQDLSCVGQCSLTVALPILSAYGFETAVLPTAVFSNHTAYPRWTSRDMSETDAEILSLWKANDVRFDAFLLGYLGSEAAIKLSLRCLREFADAKAPVVIDPAFGDSGELYAPFDSAYVEAMRTLLPKADVILPNWTEACALTGRTYQENPSEAMLRTVLEELSSMTDGTVILTGFEQNGQIGERIVRGGIVTDLLNARIPGHYFGTGDVFSAVFTAGYLTNGDLVVACREASAFVEASIRATEPEHRYGVRFESVLAAHRPLGSSNGKRS
jgi:pyridoxine kinase